MGFRSTAFRDCILLLVIVAAVTARLHQPLETSSPDIIKRLIALQGAKKWAEAVDVSTDYLKTHPRDARIYCARGSYYGHLKEHDKAIADYERSLSLDSRAYGAHNNVAWEHFCLGHYQQAADYSERAVQMSPNDSSVLDTRACALAGLKRWKEAEDAERLALRHQANPEYQERLNSIMHHTVPSPESWSGYR